jgi:hypothetical protein
VPGRRNVCFQRRLVAALANMTTCHMSCPESKVLPHKAQACVGCVSLI